MKFIFYSLYLLPPTMSNNVQRNSKLAKTTQSILIRRHILKCFDTHKQNISTYTRLQLQNLQHSMLCFKLSITQCSTQLAKAMNRTEQNRTELTLPNCLANQSIQTSSKQNRTAQPDSRGLTFNTWDETTSSTTTFSQYTTYYIVIP